MQFGLVWPQPWKCFQHQRYKILDKLVLLLLFPVTQAAQNWHIIFCNSRKHSTKHQICPGTFILHFNGIYQRYIWANKILFKSDLATSVCVWEGRGGAAISNPVTTSRKHQEVKSCLSGNHQKLYGETTEFPEIPRKSWKLLSQMLLHAISLGDGLLPTGKWHY